MVRAESDSNPHSTIWLNTAPMTVAQLDRTFAALGDPTRRAILQRLSAGEATVQYDERLTSPDKLKSAVEGAGYEIGVTPASRTGQTKAGCCCA